MPDAYEKPFLHIFNRFKLKIRRWFAAQLALSLIIGILVGVGLWLLGVKYFLVLAILAAVFEIVPIIGPILAGAAAFLIASSSSISLGLYTLLFFFVVQPGRAQIAARDVVMSTQMNERFTIYHDAMNLSPIGNDARKIFLSAFTSTLILDIKSEVVLKNRELFERELRLAESGLKETINSHPTFLRAYLNLGLLYQAWARIIDEKKFTDAESVLSTAIFLFPNNSLPQWQLVGVYLDQKQFQTALELADRAFALDTNVRHSYFRYLLTLKLAGQEQELHNMTEETQKVDPEFFYLIEPFLSLDISNEEVRELVITRFYYATSFLFDVNQIE